MELQQKYLPTFDFSKTESTLINCPEEKIFPFIQKLEFKNSKVIYWLFKLRGIPVPESLTLEGLEKLGFIKLEFVENRELILGLVGKFWTIKGQLKKMNPQQFVSFSDSEFAKTTWNFKLNKTKNENQTEVSTETRILCTDSKNRRKLKLYWSIIQPFSSLIRKEILKSVKYNSEKK